MRKKIFTLLALLLTVCSGAWADDYTYAVTNSTYTGGQTVTSVSGVTLTIGAASDAQSTTFKVTDAKSVQVGISQYFVAGNNNPKTSGNANISFTDGIANATNASGSFYKFAFSELGKFTLGYSIGKDKTMTIIEHSSMAKIDEVANTTGSTTYGSKDYLVNSGETYEAYASGSKLGIFGFKFVPCTSHGFDGVKVGGVSLTAEAATSGYTISSTTITLSSDIEVSTAPTNITLTHKYTFKDASEMSKDVAVSFDGTMDGDYYTGTATINSVNYTVKIKKSNKTVVTLAYTPSSAVVELSDVFSQPVLSATGTDIATLFAAGAISFESSTPATATVSADGIISIVAAGTTTITASISGNATYADASATFGLTVRNSAAATKWNFDITGTKDATYLESENTLGDGSLWIFESNQYKSQNIADDVTLSANGKNLASAEGLTFDLKKADAFRYDMANKRAWINGETVVNIKNLKKGQLLIVNYASSKKDTERGFTLTNLSETSWMTTSTSGADFSANVSADGDVTMKASGGVYFYSITIIDPVEVSTVSGRNYATCVPTKRLDFGSADGITAYIATGLNGSKTSVVLQEVSVVDAGTPVIVMTDTKGATVNVPVTTTAADDTEGNLLVAGDGTTAWNGTSGYVYYYLASDQMHKATSGTLQSGKAYMKIAEGDATAPAFSFVFGDVTTGIETVRSTQTVSGNAIFNMQGQRIGQPRKGLFIVGGKKVVMK